MSALGHFIERSGVAAVSISLVRDQTEKVTTPRALWVPFALGRPLGAADDPALQTEVVRAALRLVESATGPVIVDWEGDEPDEAGPEQWACPLNLGPRVDDSLSAALAAEVGRLRPWAEETRRTRGRTLFGVSGATTDQIDAVVGALGHIADTGEISNPPPGDAEWAFEMPLLIRHLVDDVRTVYHEALAAQPGAAPPNHDALNAWIFGGTALGETLTAIGDHLAVDDSPLNDLVRRLTIPEGHYRDGEGAWPGLGGSSS